jgi:hypothetical protein
MTRVFEQAKTFHALGRSAIVIGLSHRSAEASYPMGAGGSLPRGRPPSSAEVKNGGAIPPLPHTFSWYSF